MKIIYTKSMWEMPGASVEAYMTRCQKDGFDGAELCVNGLKETPAEILASTERHALALIAQVITSGRTPVEHREAMGPLMAFAAACRPSFINLHAGRDFFPLEENLSILRQALALGEEHGIPICFETHRGRPTFSSLSTLALLEAIPELRLTADVSHWMCVHESDLSDQPEAVARAMRHADHIHARVGFDQGPQVGHPLAPENSHWLEIHLAIWKAIVTRRQEAGAALQTITPEFGPIPYMPALAFTRQPVADTWSINREMMQWLRRNLG